MIIRKDEFSKATDDIKRTRSILMKLAFQNYRMLLTIKDVSAGRPVEDDVNSELERTMIDLALLLIEIGNNAEAATATDILRIRGDERHIERLKRALQRDDLSDDTREAIQLAIDEINEREHMNS